MKQSGTCADGYTGPHCSACEFGLVRDKFGDLCQLCPSSGQTWILILGIQGRCVLTALFGLFTAYRAILSSTSLAKLDSLLIRIFMHFSTVGSVLQHLDLADMAGLAASTGSGTQTSQVPFPSWLQSAADVIFSFAGNILVFQSDQEAVECLAIQWVNTVHAKRIIPMIWWVLYPVNVLMWIMILAILLAKVGARTTSQKAKRDKEFPIFGMFRSASLWTAPSDAMPAMLITLYTMWATVTQRYLIAIRASRLSGPTPGSTVVVWKDDMRLTFFGSEHETTGMFGVVGLLLWSVSGPFSIFILCFLRRDKLQHLRTRHWIGYFYLGLEPQYFWWELLVKRLDLLLVFIIAYTNIVPTATGKLFAYSVLASIVWIVQSLARPYDDRYVNLADRAEAVALKARFITNSTLSLLVVVNGGKILCYSGAIFVLVSNAYSVLWIVLCIVTELFSSDQQFSAQVACLKNHFCTAGLARLLSWATYILSTLGREKSRQEERVSVLVWHGFGRVSVAPGMEAAEQRITSCVPGGFSFGCLIAHLYRTDAEHQYSQAADTLSQMLQYITAQAQMKRWLPNTIDMLMLLSIAIKRLYSDRRSRQIELQPEVVCKEMHLIASKSAVQTAQAREPDAWDWFSDQASCGSIGDDCYPVSSEDLSVALIYVQSLSKDSLLLLLTHLSQVAVETKKDLDASLSSNPWSRNVQWGSEAKNREDMDSHEIELDTGNKRLANRKQDLAGCDCNSVSQSNDLALESHNQNSADRILQEPSSPIPGPRQPKPHSRIFKDSAVQVDGANMQDIVRSSDEEPLQFVRQILELESHNRTLVEQNRILAKLLRAQGGALPNSL